MRSGKEWCAPNELARPRVRRHVMAHAIELVVNAALIGAAVLAIGYPIARVVLIRWSWTFAYLFGLASLQVASWSWMNATGRTMRPVALFLLVGGLAATAAVIRCRGFHGRSTPPRRVGFAIVVFGIVAVFLVHYQPVWSSGSYTQPTGGTADVAGYSLIADHLLERGIDHPGTFAGHDLGRQARVDVFGAYAYVAFAGHATPDETWVVNLPALLVAFVALGVSLYETITAFVRRADVVLGVIVVCSLAGYFTIYSLTQYFLSQFLAMVAVPAVVLVALRFTQADRRSMVGLVLAAAAIVAMVDMTYPQMLFTALPIATVAALLAGLISAERFGPRVVARGQLRAIGGLAGGAALGLVLCTTRAPESIRRTLALGDAVAGWPLPKVTPVELVGFQRTFQPETPRSYLLWSLVLLGGVVLAGVVLTWRRRLAGVAPALIAASLYASYAYAYRREGVSYRQWKWLSYLAPMIVAGGLATLLAGAFAIRPSLGARGRRVVAAIAVFTLTGFLTVQTANARAFSRWMDREPGVPPDLADLGELHTSLDEGSININISPRRTGSSVWETQWVAYFTRDLRGYMLSANLMALAPPCATWTLMRRDDPDAAIAAIESRVVNDTYELVRLGDVQGSHLRGTVEFPVAPAAPVQVLLSSGPDDAPNTLAVRYLLDDMAELVFFRGAAEVLVGSPFLVTAGTRQSIDVIFGDAGRLAVTLDGGNMLDVTTTFDMTFGRGLLVAFNGRTVPMAPFDGGLALVAPAQPGCEMGPRG
jgi:hypothetical protein